MADLRISQAGSTVVTELTQNNMRLSMSVALTVANFPSEAAQVAQAGATVVAKERNLMRASQAAAMVVARGRVDNPNLRAWWFPLDAHEFYVLSLGNGKTLVFDRLTDSWSWWSTSDKDYWRASFGTSWTQSGAIPRDYGSAIVVGDDSTGILWVLDPWQGFDDSPRAGDRSDNVVVPFPRIATGQVLIRGRVTIPCYQTYLVSDTGQPAYTGASVSLSYSDDQGKTFVSAGNIEAQAGNYYQEFAWRSLGLVRSPGRLFRIEDDGAFARIDELSIADVSAT